MFQPLCAANTFKRIFISRMTEEHHRHIFTPIKHPPLMKIPSPLITLCILPLANFADPATVNIVERGPHHRVMQTITSLPLEDGTTAFQTNSFTEMANGLNYLDPNGQWVESNEQIEIINGYGVANHAQHQLILSPQTEYD